MKLQSQKLTDYLQCTAIIDWQTPAIIEQTQAVTASLTQDIAKAQALFEWVRDTIPHSNDIGTDVVTCTASEVLAHRTGLCYAKSHLLAAMLRCAGIPAGLCYQVFRRQPLCSSGVSASVWRDSDNPGLDSPEPDVLRGGGAWIPFPRPLGFGTQKSALGHQFHITIKNARLPESGSCWICKGSVTTCRKAPGCAAQHIHARRG